jgi:hypothetical protein
MASASSSNTTSGHKRPRLASTADARSGRDRGASTNGIALPRPPPVPAPTPLPGMPPRSQTMPPPGSGVPPRGPQDEFGLLGLGLDFGLGGADAPGASYASPAHPTAQDFNFGLAALFAPPAQHPATHLHAPPTHLPSPASSPHTAPSTPHSPPHLNPAALATLMNSPALAAALARNPSLQAAARALMSPGQARALGVDPALLGVGAGRGHGFEWPVHGGLGGPVPPPAAPGPGPGGPPGSGQETMDTSWLDMLTDLTPPAAGAFPGASSGGETGDVEMGSEGAKDGDSRRSREGRVEVKKEGGGPADGLWRW